MKSDHEKKWAPDIHDLDEAEQGVLGAALIDPDKVLATMARWDVKPAWFRLPTGQGLCAVLLGMQAEGKPIDPITVADEAEKRGLNGIYPVLETLLEKVPTASHGGYYVSILAERWTDRAIRDACADAVSALDAHEAPPAEVLAKTVDRMVRLVSASRAGAEPSVYDIMNHAIDSWVDARNGKALGLPLPFANMNEITCGLFPGINVVAARPSGGKSIFEGVLVRSLLMAGKKVARACLDMPREALVSRDLSANGGEPLNKMRAGFMTASDETKMRLTAEAMRGWNETIIEDRTSEGIVARARGIWANGGLDLLTVDYAQLLDVTVSSRDNDNVRIGKAVARLKEFSVTTGVPVVVLSQLSREVEKEGRRPQLSDLRDSGSLEQEASTVAFLYAEPTVGKAWCAAQGLTEIKQLNVRPVVWDLMKNQQGKTGTVGLRMNAKYFQMEPAHRWKQGDRYNSDNLAGGYDFSVPGEPEGPDRVGEYVVCRHPKGAYEAFSSAWFARINEAAARLGQEPYVELRRAVGVSAAMSALEQEKAKTRKADHLADLDAMADADAETTN